MEEEEGEEEETGVPWLLVGLGALGLVMFLRYRPANNFPVS